MTNDEIEVMQGLINILGTQLVSDKEFLSSFRGGVGDIRVLVATLLREALESGNAAAVSSAMIVGHRFGFATTDLAMLLQLYDVPWHYSYESILSAIGEFKDPRAVDLLYHAALSPQSYRDPDDARAFTRKAMWALSKIPGDAAEIKLELLSTLIAPELREETLERLAHHVRQKNNRAT